MKFEIRDILITIKFLKAMKEKSRQLFASRQRGSTKG